MVPKLYDRYYLIYYLMLSEEWLISVNFWKRVPSSCWHLLQIKNGEIIQSLRALAALPEYQGSIIWEQKAIFYLQFHPVSGLYRPLNVHHILRDIY